MPGTLHGFNGPDIASRFAELAGLWQATPQKAKKRPAPASEQNQRSLRIGARYLPTSEIRSTKSETTFAFPEL
jgi:hypothetical protein